MNGIILRSCLLSGLLFLALEGRPNNHSDSLIQVLTEAIENRDVSVRLRLERIEKLKVQLRFVNGKFAGQVF